MFSQWKFFSQKRGFCGFIGGNVVYRFLVLERKSKRFSYFCKRKHKLFFATFTRVLQEYKTRYVVIQLFKTRSCFRCSWNVGNVHQATFIGQKIPLRTQKFIVLRRFFYQLYSFCHPVQVAPKSKKKAFFQVLHLNTLLLLRPRVRVVIASGTDSLARVIFHSIIGITRVYISSFYHVERIVYKSAVGTPYARGASFYNRQSALHTRAWWRSQGEHWHTRRARGGEKKQKQGQKYKE